MLVDFKFRNFKSFRDEQHFSMVASADKSLPQNTASVEGMGRERLVKSAAFYGANASGKSNFVQALDFFRDYIIDSERLVHATRLTTRPFLFQETPSEPSDFEITFVDAGTRYQYGFSLDDEQVRREWLIAYPNRLPQRWFERTWNGEDFIWEFGPNFRGEKNRLATLTRPDALFLSVGAQLNHQQLTNVQRWFLLRFSVLTDSMQALALSRLDRALSTEFVAADESLRNYLTSLLQSADLGIRDILLQEETVTPEMVFDALSERNRSIINLDEFERQYSNTSYRTVSLLHHTANTSTVSLPFESESAGTQRLYMLAGYIILSLRIGATLVIDELGSSLHPTLVRAIVEMFNSEANDRNAQLIFNTHDTNLLDPTLFRRDQIWFVEKDTEGASHLYSLLDYKPRKGEALAKGYLQGRYGAIPLIGAEFSKLLADAKE